MVRDFLCWLSVITLTELGPLLHGNVMSVAYNETADHNWLYISFITNNWWFLDQLPNNCVNPVLLLYWVHDINPSVCVNRISTWPVLRSTHRLRSCPAEWPNGRRGWSPNWRRRSAPNSNCFFFGGKGGGVVLGYKFTTCWSLFMLYFSLMFCRILTIHLILMCTEVCSLDPWRKSLIPHFVRW